LMAMGQTTGLRKRDSKRPDSIKTSTVTTSFTFD